VSAIICGFANQVAHEGYAFAALRLAAQGAIDFCYGAFTAAGHHFDLAIRKPVAQADIHRRSFLLMRPTYHIVAASNAGR
jgi:hypothetical protein